jgi:hypothetical protein
MKQIPGVKVDLTPEEQHAADLAELTKDITRALDAEVAAGRYKVVGHTLSGKKLYRKAGE